MSVTFGSAGANGLTFQMPESIEVEHSTYSTTFGRFVIQPLERGFGTTLGNAIRRTLLSSIPGAAITSIRIEGVPHEFSTVKGVKEDVVEIVLALKEIRLKMLHGRKTEKVRMHLKGPMVLVAADLQHSANDFEILNPELEIAHLNEDAEFDFEFHVNQGLGYVPAEENRDSDMPIGTIPIDAIYTPIDRVKYQVENTRVGQRIDYEKLTIDITTDGSITPDDALSYSGKILRDHISLLINLDVGHVEEVEVEETDEDILRVRRLLRRPVDELELSVRSANCLKEARIRIIADLVGREESEMLKFKNFGRKSLTELNEVLETHGLHFGFDIERYLGPGARKNLST